MAATGASRAPLPRAERLRDRRELQRLFHRGSRVERASFVLLWSSIPGRRAVAFTAGRKLGGSVRRNRARRRLREAYRRQAALLPETGLRLCFVARPRVVAVSFLELSSEVAEALRHAARRLAS
jgi:ribonuclease P protein component